MKVVLYVLLFSSLEWEYGAVHSAVQQGMCSETWAAPHEGGGVVELINCIGGHSEPPMCCQGDGVTLQSN